jgi:hypothetical protein
MIFTVVPLLRTEIAPARNNPSGNVVLLRLQGRDVNLWKTFNIFMIHFSGSSGSLFSGRVGTLI